MLEAEPRTDLRGEREVKLRHLGQERVPVVRETVLDLVLDLELDEADHRRLPERQHLPVEAGLELGGFVGRERDAIAPLQEPRDLALAVEDALALHFGRVCRQHRAHERVAEPRRDPLPVDALPRHAVERVRDAAPLRRRAGERVAPPAPVLVDVLGDVDEMREIAERADDVERLRDRQVVHQCIELALDAGRVVLARTPEAHGRLPDRLDPRIAGFAGLRPQHVAQQAAEQARVLAQREILVGVGRIQGEVLSAGVRFSAASSAIPDGRTPERPAAAAASGRE